MTMPHNPALHEEPRSQPMTTILPIPRESLLSWLESTGRFQVSENDDTQERKISEDIDDILESENYESKDDEEEL